MASMTGLARLKHRAADARKSLAARRLPALPLSEEEEAGISWGPQELGLGSCRSVEAVQQGWAAKVFPGEGKGFESERGNTFSGETIEPRTLQLPSLVTEVATCLQLHDHVNGACLDFSCRVKRC